MIFFPDPYKWRVTTEKKSEQIDADIEFLSLFFLKDIDDVIAGWKSFSRRDIRLYRFLSSIQFFEHALNRELKPDAHTLPILVAVFSIEGILGHFGKFISNRYCGNNERRIRFFFLKYLDRPEKIKLLSYYLFGKPYLIGKKNDGNLRHLMYLDCINEDTTLEEEWCSPSDGSPSATPVCYCAEWLNRQQDKIIDGYIPAFTRHLYKMRCSIAHSAILTHFVSQKLGEADENIEMYDVYCEGRNRNGKDIYVPYSTELTATKAVEIFKNAFWRYFTATK